MPPMKKKPNTNSQQPSSLIMEAVLSTAPGIRLITVPSGQRVQVLRPAVDGAPLTQPPSVTHPDVAAFCSLVAEIVRRTTGENRIQ